MAGKEIVVDDTKQEMSNVSVQLDDNNQPIKPVEKKEEPKYVRVEDLDRLSRAIENTRDYSNKRTQTLEQKIDQLLNANKLPVQPKPEPTEWDTKLQKDWKGTVEELADKRFEERMRAQREQEAAQYEKQRNFQLLESNKSKVLERHKELNDETSEKANVYRQVLTEHPEYLNNPFGPVLAMRDMEEKIGYVPTNVQQKVNGEIARQVRANAGAVPKGSGNPSNPKSITLTKEQKEFCDLKGIKYEKYAQFANQLANKEGVEA
jgi:hypothetical protein